MPIIQSRPKACDIINQFSTGEYRYQPVCRQPNYAITPRAKFFICPTVLHISYGYPNFKCRLGYFINLNSKGGMIMNFSKAGRCCLEYHRVNTKKKYGSLL